MKYALAFFSLWFLLGPIQAQNGQLHKFKQLSWPEKRWVCTHPLVAKKAQVVSIEARRRSDSLLLDPRLDGDAQGGAVDAFRHAWWMASLSQSIGSRRALSLGRAHERANFRAHRKGTGGGHHDQAMQEMDLQNNAVGVKLIQKGEVVTAKELDELVIQAILQGKLWVLAKDTDGNYLNADGQVLSESAWKGLWNSARCLQASH